MKVGLRDGISDEILSEIESRTYCGMVVCISIVYCHVLEKPSYVLGKEALHFSIVKFRVDK